MRPYIVQMSFDDILVVMMSFGSVHSPIVNLLEMY